MSILLDPIPWTLERTGAPTSVVPLPELIAHVRGQGVIDEDPAEEAGLKEFGEAAEDAVEKELRRALAQQTWVLRLAAFPCFWLKLPRPPLKTLTSVQYVDPNGSLLTLDPSKYVVDSSAEPARLYPAYGLDWPDTRWQPDAVRVTYDAGGADYQSIPALIRVAIKMTAAGMYENRERDAAEILRELVMYERLLANYRCYWEPLYV